ncbi:MAG: hypothetical protein IPK22_11290 [Verrucomicrobiaceae bacterium]|nr:hypothetical protein [Verrucomicrobiaceae bacterium]
MPAQSPDSPLIRARNPFEKRTHEAIARNKINPHSPGILSRTHPGGTVITPQRSRSSGSAGGIVDTTPIWGIRSDYKITPGTIGGRIPTYGGTSLSPIGSANAVPSTGNHQLWLKVTWTITKDANGYLTSRSVSSVVIQNSEPTESETVKKLFLLECVDGVWTQPAVSGSRSAVLCNTGANETAPTFGTA